MTFGGKGLLVIQRRRKYRFLNWFLGPKVETFPITNVRLKVVTCSTRDCNRMATGENAIQLPACDQHYGCGRVCCG